MGKQGKCLSVLLCLAETAERNTWSWKKLLQFNKKKTTKRECEIYTVAKERQKKNGQLCLHTFLFFNSPLTNYEQNLWVHIPASHLFGFLLLPPLLCLLIESDGFTYVCVKKRSLLYCLGSLGSDQTWRWVNETPTEAKTSSTFW